MQSQQGAQQGAQQEIVGVDIGGTFTDIVLSTPTLSSSEGSGTLRIYKVPSTPHDPVQGLMEGLQALQAEHSTVVIQGSIIFLCTL